MAQIRDLLDERTSKSIREGADVSVVNEVQNDRLLRMAGDFLVSQELVLISLLSPTNIPESK